MFELTPQNVIEYLLAKNQITSTDVLIQELGGGVSGMVLKVLDMNAGEPVGTDLRTPGQIKRGVPDQRMRAGKCLVLKQPREQFRVAAAWQVDCDRIWLERDALRMLAERMPTETLPQVLWEDAENLVLAISPAPPEYVNLKTSLLAGKGKRWWITQAARWLAHLHRATMGSAGHARFTDARLFEQQRIDPYFRHLQSQYPAVAERLGDLCQFLLSDPICLIHGDYSPKNILVSPEPGDHSGVFIVDFEVVFVGQPIFDIATLMNHLLLKGFYRAPHWRAFMLMADEAWHAYSEAAGPSLIAAHADWGAVLLGSLLLARVDGKSPVEYLTDESRRDAVRACALELLTSGGSLDDALDIVGDHLNRLD
ncbi:MAG: phosphotransferase [Phycisphaerae bacterium]